MKQLKLIIYKTWGIINHTHWEAYRINWDTSYTVIIISVSLGVKAIIIIPSEKIPYNKTHTPISNNLNQQKKKLLIKTIIY